MPEKSCGDFRCNFAVFLLLSIKEFLKFEGLNFTRLDFRSSLGVRSLFRCDSDGRSRK